MVAAVCWCLGAGAAAAFPVTDPSTPSFVPTGADLAAPDVRDLNHQMQLLSGFGSAGAGWTILPRISLQEQFTDNVLEVQAPRRWDLTTIVAPGVAVLGDTGRVQMRLNYEPTLQMHITTGSQNVLAQQLDTTGLVTVVPDLFFIDLRAVAGVQATNGGIGGIGGLGQGGVGPVTPTSLTQNSSLGLSKQNRTQTASFSISPYVLYHFGDIGNGKLGVSANRSSFSNVTGFAPIPLLNPGTNEQRQTSLEEFLQFQSGDIITALRDTFTASAQQATSVGTGSRNTSRNTASDKLEYQYNRSISVYVQAGWEDIVYGGGNALNINGPTWGFGTTLTPNADSTLTVGYGHQNGTNSLNFNARYALTARTILTANYVSGIGTQLEQVRNQLDQSTVANNGSLVNSQTGGPQFVNNNALGVSAGIFRYSTLSFSSTTVLDRDTITLTLSYSQNTQVGSGVRGTSSSATTGGVSYQHQLNPDLIASVNTYYSIGTPTAGNKSQSLAAYLGLQYILSDTMSAFARYTFYDRRASGPGLSMYQDLFILGVTKQF